MGEDFDTSWRTVGPRLTLLVSAAQLGSARNGAAYVPAVLRETGQTADPEGRVNTGALSGRAADGRDLDGLLYGSVAQARVDVALGSDPRTALERGGRWLDMAVQTAVADAGRQAVGVGIASRPRLGGWVRMLNPPSCSRCAVLAGKWFRWNTGFQRHPRCDCVHIPSSEDIAGDFRTNPDQAARDGLVTDLTATEKQALTEGADLGHLVNARRGRAGLRGMTTTEGTTRRGLAGQRLGRGTPRLTPEGVYRRAQSRTEAIDLLRRHGYLL
jgi:hypothetical protein